MLPVVVTLSLPNEIASEPEAIEPSLIVMLPIEEPDPIVAIPEVIVPVVERFSFPKEISPLESVIDPSDKVKFPIVEVEATKTVAEAYAPMDCVITEVNSNLETEPELINNDPVGDGWMVKAEIKEMDDSGMSYQEYESFIS